MEIGVWSVEQGEESRESRFHTLSRSPSLEQVFAYAEAVGRPEEAEPFHEKYEARGWVTFGRNPVPVNDWQAEFRGWVRWADRHLQGQASHSGGNGFGPPKRDTATDRARKSIEADIASGKIKAPK